MGNPCSSRQCWFGGLAGLVVGRPLTHRLAFEMDFVCAVQKAVEDCVGERRVADVLMPMLEGQLAGDERGSGADAIIRQFEQTGALPRSDGGDRKVIDHHEVQLGDGGEAFIALDPG